MVMVPAKCHNCGLMWSPPQLINVAPGSMGITLENVGTTCPRCGSKATFLEGTFNVAPTDQIEMVTGPAWSQELIEKLSIGLPKIVADPAVNPVKEVAKLDPLIAQAIADAVEEGLRRGPLKAKSKNRRKLARGMVTKLADWVGAAVVGQAALDPHHVEEFARMFAKMCQYVATHGMLPPS